MKNNQFIIRDIFQRAAELLGAEVVISLLLAALTLEGIIPVSSKGIIVLGLGLMLYFAFVVWNSYEYLSLVMEKEQYFKVSYAAYGIVAVISIIIRYTLPAVMTWMFFPMKAIMVFGLGRTPALLAAHAIVFAIISVVGVIINPIIPVDKSEEELQEIGYVPGSENLWTEEGDE